MKMLELTDNETAALKVLLYSDYKIYRDRVGHAASHGEVYTDDYGSKIERIIEKIENDEA